MENEKAWRYQEHRASIEAELEFPTIEDALTLEKSLEEIIYTGAIEQFAKSENEYFNFTGKLDVIIASGYDAPYRLGLAFDYLRWHEQSVNCVAFEVAVEERLLDSNKVRYTSRHVYSLERHGAKLVAGKYRWMPLVEYKTHDLSERFVPKNNQAFIAHKKDGSKIFTMLPDDMGQRDITVYDLYDLRRYVGTIAEQYADNLSA